MTHRTVRDVMTAPVATVGEDTSFKHVAEIMAEHGVGALPVLDAGGRVVGIVSQIDLLRKEEYQDDPKAPRPPLFSHDGRSRSAGLTAKDVMSLPVVTIAPEASVVAAARALDRGHVGHLVVTHPDGTIAGIISPRDLLKVYLRPDEEIRAEIVDDVLTKYCGTDPSWVDVKVSEGVVTMRGQVDHKSMVPLAARMARAVDGVVSVVAKLDYRVDDSHRPLASELDAP